MTMDVDAALTHLGKWGRWQMFTYTLVCLSVTTSGCWHMMVGVFTGGEQEHYCKLPEGADFNTSIPLKRSSDGTLSYSHCLMYTNITINNDTQDCVHGYVYKQDEFISTIGSEWDLVCSRSYLVETSQSLFCFGVMVGAIVFTTLADKVGRKPVHLGCQYAMIGIGIGHAFVPTYSGFLVLRFFLGALREGAGLTGIVMACEIFPASERTFAGAALELFWAGSWMVLSVIAYFIRDWKILQLTISIGPVISIVLIWLLPESIPWLAANNQVDKAEKILRQAAAMNNVEFPDEILQVKESRNGHMVDTRYRQSNGDAIAQEECQPLDGKNHVIRDTSWKSSVQGWMRKIQFWKKDHRPPPVAEEKAAHKNVTCMDLLKSKKMMLYASIMCSLWFASGIVYYGLSLSTSTLAGNKYMNFFISGAVEAPAYMLTVVVLQKYGRRWPLCIFHTVAGTALFVNIFIPDKSASGASLAWVTTTLVMIGKFAMTAAFGTVVLYAPEIYPTNIRNVGFGFASVAGRIAATIAPFSAYIGRMVSWAPGLVFTIASISTGVLALLLPETLNRPLPDTIEEIESWSRSGIPRPIPDAGKQEQGNIPEGQRNGSRRSSIASSRSATSSNHAVDQLKSSTSDASLIATDRCSSTKDDTTDEVRFIRDKGSCHSDSETVL